MSGRTVRDGVGDAARDGRGDADSARSATARDGRAAFADTPAWLLTGRVMHERLRPVRHRFTYPVFCVRCDLARLSSLRRWWFGIDRWAPLGLRLCDHGACDGGDLQRWMRDELARAGIPADGAIWLQTMPRIFGYAFNPVSFWFCHDRDGQLRALLAEVRNTFGARHRYLLSAPGHAPIDADTELTCRKEFHVSPFCRVEGSYAFRVREQGARMCVTIDYRDRDGLLIRTAIGTKAAPLTGARALLALLRQPWMTVAVVVWIHWEALRLLVKRVPFFGRKPGVE